MDASPTVAPRARSRVWAAVRVGIGIAGLGVVAWLVHDVGVDALTEVLLPALPFVPLAAGLELLRVGMDALSTRASLGRRGAEVPLLPLFGSHVVAFAVMGVAPAGRATAEAVKASLLARWIGGPTAAAVGTANQANVLLSSGTFTLASAVAAYATTGMSVLTWALLAHTVFMNACGLALRAASRYERLGAFLARRFPRLAQHVDVFHAASRETSLYPPVPVLTMMFGRALQAGHFAVLAAAVGVTPSVAGALALQGVYLVIAAIGVVVPGQLGASEGGFAWSAEILHMTEAQALSIALLAHGVQFAVVAAGFVILALWPPAPATSGPAPE